MLERLKKIFKIENKKSKKTIYDAIDELFHSLNDDVLRIEVGEDLVPFGEDIINITGCMRNEIKNELGLIIPTVHILDNSLLQENEYKIYVKGKEIYTGYAIPNKMEITNEIYENLKTSVLNNMKNILTNELTEKYIESVRAQNNLLVWDITGAISTSEIRMILSDLLEKGKSIKNISSIFEKISEQIFIYNKFDYRNPHKISDEIFKQI